MAEEEVVVEEVDVAEASVGEVALGVVEGDLLEVVAAVALEAVVGHRAAHVSCYFISNSCTPMTHELTSCPRVKVIVKFMFNDLWFCQQMRDAFLLFSFYKAITSSFLEITVCMNQKGQELGVGLRKPKFCMDANRACT